MDSDLAFGARTTRGNNFVGIAKCSGTSDLPRVGPGAYETPSSLRLDRATPDAVSNAAFGSASQRKFNINGDTGVTVGPGSYGLLNNGLSDGSLEGQQSQIPHETVSESEEMTARTEARTEAMRVARGGSLYERKQRQSEAKRITPGPGQYCVTDNHWGNGHGAVAMHTVFGVDAVMAKSRQVGGGGAVTWMRIPTAPTIPGRAQGFGYEEGRNGELVMVKDAAKRYTGGVGDVPGPGEYTPQLPSSKSTNFGRGSVRPDLSIKLSRPKVADMFGNETPDEEDRFLPSPPKPSSMFLSSERGQPTKSKKVRGGNNSTPGPGHYDKPSTLKGGQSGKTPEQLQFFGSTSQRFSSGPRNIVGGAPGPGAYGNPRSSFDQRGSRVSVQPSSDRVAFQSSGQRSELKGQSQCEVGPGEYELPGMSDELLRKQKRQNYVRKEDFEARKSQLNKQAYGGSIMEESTPGPTSYFSNYGTNTSPIKRSGSVQRGDGGQGMLKGSVLRFEVHTPPPQQSSSFQNTSRDMPATNRARLAASGSQLGHGVDYNNRNDVNGIHRGGPLTATESSRVYTSNPVLAMRESHRFQLAEGALPQPRGPDLMRSTGRDSQDRAGRGDTNCLVGPGSYESITSPQKFTHARSARGVMDSRDNTRVSSFAGVSSTSIQGPGPGEYNSRTGFLLPTFNAAIAESVRV